MKEFILIFRADYQEIASVTDEEMQRRNDQWLEWLHVLVAKNALAKGGNHLDSGGKVLRTNDQITDGPFQELKEAILGYILINALSYDQAIELTKTCPLLSEEGTSVEIREIA
jgi:hypothetical protein